MGVGVSVCVLGGGETLNPYEKSEIRNQICAYRSDIGLKHVGLPHCPKGPFDLLPHTTSWIQQWHGG